MEMLVLYLGVCHLSYIPNVVFYPLNQYEHLLLYQIKKQ